MVLFSTKAGLKTALADYPAKLDLKAELKAALADYPTKKYLEARPAKMESRLTWWTFALLAGFSGLIIASAGVMLSIMLRTA